MRWSDRAIIISVSKFREDGAIVRLFSQEQGLFAGACRYAFSKKQRPIFQPGNLVQADWSARLADHLGNLRCELIEPVAAFLMQDADKLLALQSALQLTLKVLAERDPHPALYRVLWALLQQMKASSAAHSSFWQEAYVKFELTLLQESGFGLELQQCAATGARSNLAYVSPKSGRAVSAKAGEPYRDRLLKLPDFLQVSACPEADDRIAAAPAEIAAGLRLTGYFLESRIFAPHGWAVPEIRQRLANRLTICERSKASM